MRLLSFLCAISLLGGCLQKPDGDVSRQEVREIHRALSKAHGPAVQVLYAIIVRDPELKPFVCGRYTTPKSRKEGFVQMFMWSRGRLLPGAFHDNEYACWKYREEALGERFLGAEPAD